MINKKNIIVLGINLLTLFCVIYTYVSFNKQNKVISESKPIKVYVKSVIYSSKSGNKCNIEYNGKLYKNISFLGDSIKPDTTDSINFYYDETEDLVFYKGIDKHTFIMITILFVISLFLWLVPNKNWI